MTHHSVLLVAGARSIARPGSRSGPPAGPPGARPPTGDATELGIISLSDIQADPVTGSPFSRIIIRRPRSPALRKSAHERGLLHEWLDRIASS